MVVVMADVLMFEFLVVAMEGVLLYAVAVVAVVL